MRVAPLLVWRESHPVRFQRYTQGDAAAAARKLCQYWNIRRQTWGERAFACPLSLTGHGALTPPDIELITMGHVVLLPNDSFGRSVLCIDLSRRMEDSPEMRKRAFFYFGQIVMENDLSQTEGFVVLFLLNENKYDAVSHEALTMILNCMPIRPAAWHIINDVSNQKRKVPFQGIATNMIRVMGKSFRRQDTFFHGSTAYGEILRSLQAHGMLQEGIPSTMGGSWNYSLWIEWLAHRLDSEPRDTLLVNGTIQLQQQHQQPYGILSPSPEIRITYDSYLQRLRKQVEEIIRHLPTVDTTPYMEASTSAPSRIWEEESNIDLFLLAENLNPLYAAERLVRYWQLRHECFGPKRYEPLCQTGENALGRKDLALLQTGFIKVLPVDSEGSPVIWIDASRLERAPSGEKNRNRCLFYMFSILVENERSRMEGAVLLLKVLTPPFDGLDIDFLDRLIQALPLRFKAVHLNSLHPVEDALRTQVEFGEQVYLHVSSSKTEIADMLRQHGLDRSGLPKCLNGKWGYGKFLLWQELRTRMEWRIPLGLTGREAAQNNFPAIKPYAVLTDDNKAERQRRLNVIHCRRKRDRQLVETQTLREQCEDLLEVHDALVAESKRLEDLIAAAKAMAERVEESMQTCHVPNKIETVAGMMPHISYSNDPDYSNQVESYQGEVVETTTVSSQLAGDDTVRPIQREYEWEQFFYGSKNPPQDESSWANAFDDDDDTPEDESPSPYDLSVSVEGVSSFGDNPPQNMVVASMTYDPSYGLASVTNIAEHLPMESTAGASQGRTTTPMDFHDWRLPRKELSNAEIGRASSLESSDLCGRFSPLSEDGHKEGWLDPSVSSQQILPREELAATYPVDYPNSASLLYSMSPSPRYQDDTWVDFDVPSPMYNRKTEF